MNDVSVQADVRATDHCKGLCRAPSIASQRKIIDRHRGRNNCGKCKRHANSKKQVSTLCGHHAFESTLSSREATAVSPPLSVYLSGNAFSIRRKLSGPSAGASIVAQPFLSVLPVMVWPSKIASKSAYAIAVLSS